MNAGNTPVAATASPADRVEPVERIVVGVDGSDGSLRALHWAIDEARLRHVGVHAVLAWQSHPSVGDLGLGSMFPTGYSPGDRMLASTQPATLPPEPDDPRRTAGTHTSAEATAVNNMLDAAISQVTSHSTDVATESVPITQEALQGHPAQVLLDTVTESDLLMVGSRGHGGFLGALLGSVSQHGGFPRSLPGDGRARPETAFRHRTDVAQPRARRCRTPRRARGSTARRPCSPSASTPTSANLSRWSICSELIHRGWTSPLGSDWQVRVGVPAWGAPAALGAASRRLWCWPLLESGG